eukprot:6186902-Pleurochrysis_carterae.AAC.4
MPCAGPCRDVLGLVPEGCVGRVGDMHACSTGSACAAPHSSALLLRVSVLDAWKSHILYATLLPQIHTYHEPVKIETSPYEVIGDYHQVSFGLQERCRLCKHVQNQNGTRPRLLRARRAVRHAPQKTTPTPLTSGPHVSDVFQKV